MPPRPYHDKSFQRAVNWRATIGPVVGKRNEIIDAEIILDRDVRTTEIFSFAIPEHGARLVSLSINGMVRATFSSSARTPTRAGVLLAIPRGNTVTAKVRFSRKCTWMGAIAGRALPPPTIENVIRQEVQHYYKILR